MNILKLQQVKKSKIKRIGTEQFSGVVYTLGIKNTHNYIANKLFISNCYVNALKSGKQHSNVVEKLLDLYENEPLNNRPFQVAWGGEGEPTSHPDFPAILETCAALQILPNYTTNGLHLTDKILQATKTYCGGVAVSCHAHLEKVWRKAAQTLVQQDVKTCLHIIVGEEGSAQRFWDIYNSTDSILYYVALPYQATGRAKAIETEREWHKFFKMLGESKVTNVALGALFYEFLGKYPQYALSAGYSIYEPELFSGYRIFDENYKVLRKSSYNLDPKFE
jgi:hypothetical protein